MSFRMSPFGGWLALAIAGAAWQVRAQDAPPDSNVFEKHGLVPLGERLWVLPREVELREKLAELPRRRERIALAEKEIEAAVQANLRAWQESRPLLAALEQSLGRLTTGDPQRPLIEKQIAAIQAAATDPARLGGKPEVARRLVDLSLDRCELLAMAAWIRQNVPALPACYSKLAAEPEIAVALAQADNQRRLGPQRSYQADL